MSVGTSTGLLIGGLTMAGALGGSAIAANASGNAASQQQQADAAALAEQQRQFNIEQQNSAPFVTAGQTSIGNVMTDLQNGKFNPPAAPQYTGGPFVAPTEQQAEATPGYQFTRDQGTKVLQDQMAAQGQGSSGGELQALDRYTTGLADSTYNDVFNRSLSTYNAGLSEYQTQLAGYGATLAGQQQQFSQEFAPAELGSGAVSNINSMGQQSTSSIAQLMQGIGTAGAAGTVGTANAITSGISSGTNNITSALLMQRLGLLGNQSGGGWINPNLGPPPAAAHL